jgi:hypothetical protein
MSCTSWYRVCLKKFKVLPVIKKLPPLIPAIYWSQWPRGLRRGSAAARLLGLLVRFLLRTGCLPLEGVLCCQVEVSATGWSGVLLSVVWVWSWRLNIEEAEGLLCNGKNLSHVFITVITKFVVSTFVLICPPTSLFFSAFLPVCCMD